MTGEVLDADERMVAHVWVRLCHEFHRVRFATQAGDGPRKCTVSAVRQIQRGTDPLLPSLVMFDILSEVVHCDGEHVWIFRAQWADGD